MHKKRRVLIIDGYNVLGVWRKGAGMRAPSIDDARDELTELIKDYAGYAGQQVIVVYDAWLSNRKQRSEERMGHLSVVFTRKGETADQYIERMVDELSNQIELDLCEVRVASSDGVEQTVILGRGATRLSARELLSEIEHTRASGRAHLNETIRPGRSTIMDHMSADMRQKLETMRRGGG